MTQTARFDVTLAAEGLRRASFSIAAEPEFAGLARKTAREVLQAWSSPVDEYNTALLLSEVFTNAMMHGVDAHAESPALIRVELVETDCGLHIEVHDPNQGPDSRVEVGQATEDSESGRGLELVDQLAAAWGCTYTPTGKLVFFDMAAAGVGVEGTPAAPGDVVAEAVVSVDSGSVARQRIGSAR